MNASRFNFVKAHSKQRTRLPAPFPVGELKPDPRLGYGKGRIIPVSDTSRDCQGTAPEGKRSKGFVGRPMEDRR
jgi:hypothetical protein